MVLWIILILSGLVYWLFFNKTRLRLPRPRGLPILGNVLQIDQARSHVTLTKWAQRYGPVFVVDLFREQVVVVNDYELIYDVLVKRGEEFSDRAQFYRLELISRGWQDIIFSSNLSPHWNVLRKASHKYLKMHGVAGTEKVEDLLGKAVEDQMQAINNYNGQPFDVRQQFFQFTSRLIYLLLFGERLGTNSSKIRTIREIVEAAEANTSFLGAGVLLDVFPWLRIFGNKTYKDIIRMNATVDSFWDTHKFSTLEHDKQPESLIKYILDLKNSLKSDKGLPMLNTLNVEMVMFDVIAGGTLTTTASLSVFVLLLLHHPHVQRKLQEEVDTVVGNQERVTLAKRAHMPYTRAAIYELFRYATIIPLLGHATSKDTTINGEFIPKDTKIIGNLWNLHHDEAFWEDPWNYRPERYLDDNGDLVPADHPNRKRFLAFGAGPRVCLGEVFALNRIFLVIASMAQRFDVTMDATKELPPCDPHFYVTGSIIHPNDFAVSMTPRDNNPHE